MGGTSMLGLPATTVTLPGLAEWRYGGTDGVAAVVGDLVPAILLKEPQQVTNLHPLFTTTARHLY
jgi:hypothetical protein